MHRVEALNGKKKVVFRWMEEKILLWKNNEKEDFWMVKR